MQEKIIFLGLALQDAEEFYGVVRMLIAFKGPKRMMCPNSEEHLDGRDLIKLSLTKFLPSIFLSEIGDAFEKDDYPNPNDLKETLKNTLGGI